MEDFLNFTNSELTSQFCPRAVSVHLVSGDFN